MSSLSLLELLQTNTVIKKEVWRSEICDPKHSASVTTHDEVRVDQIMQSHLYFLLPLLPPPARLKIKVAEDTAFPEQT